MIQLFLTIRHIWDIPSGGYEHLTSSHPRFDISSCKSTFSLTPSQQIRELRCIRADLSPHVQDRYYNAPKRLFSHWSAFSLGGGRSELKPDLWKPRIRRWTNRSATCRWIITRHERKPGGLSGANRRIVTLFWPVLIYTSSWVWSARLETYCYPSESEKNPGPSPPFKC